MAMMKTDSQIKEAVLSELKWDTRVHEPEIGVAVKQRVVTLTGTVASYAMKTAAQEAAHRVGGVLDVANDIQVHIAGTSLRTDPEIAAAVRAALEWNVFVPDTRVRTTVADGWVTLEGKVNVWSECAAAESAIRNLAGVRGVRNHLTVEPAVTPSDLKTAIAGALARHADREARDIAITVKDGTVTVTGTVDSWAEKQAALGAVRGTHGVRMVKDELRIG